MLLSNHFLVCSAVIGESILQALWKHSMVTRVGSVQPPTILGEVELIVTLLGTLWRAAVGTGWPKKRPEAPLKLLYL